MSLHDGYTPRRRPPRTSDEARAFTLERISRRRFAQELMSRASARPNSQKKLIAERATQTKRDRANRGKVTLPALSFLHGAAMESDE